MSNDTCILEDCTGARYQRHKYCGSHYMKWYRYGDPLHKPQRKFRDLTGMQFGYLTVVEREGRLWRCSCSCGLEVMAQAGSLNRGTHKSCGVKARHRRMDIKYGPAHERVRDTRGAANTHSCVDCGKTAQQWSYTHDDPHEMTSDTPELMGIAYSATPKYYDPRCVSCHKLFDLGRINAAYS